MILGHNTYCKIRTEQTFKGRPEDPIVEGTTLGWIIHVGEEYADDKSMYIKEASEYEELYSLDVLGVEDRGEDDQSDVYSSFKESITPTMNTSPSRKKISMLKSTSPISGKHYWRETSIRIPSE